MNVQKLDSIVRFIRSLYGRNNGFIPLHTPVFGGNEKRYLNDCIDTGFVSSVGAYVDRFEQMIQELTGIRYAVATVNGTAALQIALLLSGVKEKEEVITQPITFVATVNAIRYCRAEPVFIDVERRTLGLCPQKLEEFLEKNTVLKDNGGCYNATSGRRIAACMPMHVFGHPVQIDRIVEVCNRYNIPIVEDAAESIGSMYKNRHTGAFGLVGVFSFNGNKTVTTGGGGMIVTNDEQITKTAKHITTTAKVPHAWEYVHDQLGYNYRLPNINAALGCAQIEQLPKFIERKREIAQKYQEFFEKMGIPFVSEIEKSRSNYWLNSILLKDREEREAFLRYTNDNKVMTRPLWRTMTRLDMYKDCQSFKLEEAYWLEDRLVNIPSSAWIYPDT